MPAPKILIIDDDQEILTALERLLQPEFELTLLKDPGSALDVLKNGNFSVVVTDQLMPDTSGIELLSKMARIKPLVTRVLLTGHTDSQALIESINRAQIYRFVTKPWSASELSSVLHQCVEYHHLRTQNESLMARLTEKNAQFEQLNRDLEGQVQQRTVELKKANEQLLELAMTDPLTGIMNRRAFERRMEEEVIRCRRYHRPFSLAMIDIDHFKRFNDMEGHLFGDEAIRKIARAFSTGIRRTDVAVRYGGEEFVILLPETELSVGKDTAERLRESVEGTKFQGKNGAAYLTLSIGIAAFPHHGNSAKSVLEAADQALYGAKTGGRNRVVCSGEDTSFFVS